VPSHTGARRTSGRTPEDGIFRRHRRSHQSASSIPRPRHKPSTRRCGLVQRQPGGPHRPGRCRGWAAVPSATALRSAPRRTCRAPVRTPRLIVVVVEGHEGFPQPVGAQAVDGIAPLGPVDGDDGHRPVMCDHERIGPVRWYGPGEGSSAAGVGSEASRTTCRVWHRVFRSCQVKDTFRSTGPVGGNMTNHVDNWRSNR